jgi:3-oxoacyl-[acyl-carrier-protein] synthase II
MQLALHDAGRKPEDVSYVNAHATATIQGDIAEGQAIAMLVGKATPVSSLKGHMGHAMAASGVLESIACVKMLQHAVLLPTLNLETPDEACGTINALQTKVEQPVSLIVKNSFALGGINCSLVLQAYEE